MCRYFIVVACNNCMHMQTAVYVEGSSPQAMMDSK